MGLNADMTEQDMMTHYAVCEIRMEKANKLLSDLLDIIINSPNLSSKEKTSLVVGLRTAKNHLEGK